MVNEVEQNRALVLRLYGAVDLSQFSQANDEHGFGLDLQEKLDAVQPGAILVYDHRLAAVVIPAAQETPHRGGKVRVARLERMIELSEEELVVAYHPPDPEQQVTHRRALSLTADLGVL